MLKENDVVTAAPYCFDTELISGTAGGTGDDTFLILACDGVWDVMSDQEAVDFVAKKSAALFESDDDSKSSAAAATHNKLGSSAAADSLNALFAPPTPIDGKSAAAGGSGGDSAAAGSGAATSGGGPSAAAVAATAAAAAVSGQKGKTAGKSMNKVCELTARALVNRALDLKSLDNVTAMVIRL